jgi:hypothetical protein
MGLGCQTKMDIGEHSNNRKHPLFLSFRISFRLLSWIGRVTDDFTFNQVNNLFGDVGGMIRQALGSEGGAAIYSRSRFRCWGF